MTDSNPRRKVTFDHDELVRVRNAARALGTTYDQFLHDAAMQAVSEVEAGDNETRLRRALSTSKFISGPAVPQATDKPPQSHTG